MCAKFKINQSEMLSIPKTIRKIRKAKNVFVSTRLTEDWSGFVRVYKNDIIGVLELILISPDEKIDVLDIDGNIYVGF